MTAVLRRLGRHQSGIHPEIWSRWSDIVGPELAKRVMPEGMRGKTLILAVKSSAWMQELSFLKAKLIERLAEEIGPGVVREIRMVLDPELPVRPSLAPLPPPPLREDDLPLPPEIAAAVDRVTDAELQQAVVAWARSHLKRH